MIEKHLEVAGHTLYCYEWDNNGEAVVLLHGGLSQTSHWDAQLLPALEDEFHVFAYDRTAHGFSGDRAGSLHFDYQTKELIAYLESVVKEPAHLIGYSDGGIIALMAAIARPELVKSIVTLGANFHHSGTLPLPEFDGFISPEDQEEYNRTSPDAPDTLATKITRMIKIWKSEPTMTTADLATIQCPVLVMAGDDDVIAHAHTIELYENIPLGQLAIIPGTSHQFIKEKPAIAQLLIQEFLEDLSYPITKMPMRRVNPRTE
jgi:pimeloyl-ACP methyl ester carboxylesterase